MKRVFLPVFAGFFLVHAAAFAQEGATAALGKHDTNAPIAVSADTFTGDFHTKVGTYSGNVVVSQGTFKLRANTVKVAVKDGKPDRITANGNVVFDSDSGTASGDTGVYELGPRTITLNGNVVLSKEKNVMRGTSLVVNLATGEAKLAAKGTPGGRVQGLFTPPPQKSHKQETQDETVTSSFLKDEQAQFLPMTDKTDTDSGRNPSNPPRAGEKPMPRVVEGSQGLVVTRVGKSFRKRPVVRAVSLTLRRGEVVGLLGPNGAGKTTCFYMITGLIPADYGTIELDGHDVTKLPMYRRARLGIGYLPQEASIFRGLTAEENIRATAELVESDPARLEAMVEELMAEFGVTHVRDTPAIALSGGERRRVEIARALATHPSYILLDEPLAGIDPIAVGEIRDLIGHLKERGVGVLITDHNVRDALEIIDRAYIIHEGQVLKEGLPGEIVGDRDVRRVYLGERFSL